GTRLLASRRDLAIANLAIFDFGVNAGSVDTLDAISALFHHASIANRHVRVIEQLQLRNVPLGVPKKIEPANLVWTVVRAISGAHTSVVGHLVDSLAAVRSGCHWAYELTRCVLAVLAEHRLKIDVWILWNAFAVRVDAQPMHLAAIADLAFTDDRNIVLGLACDDARITSDAGAKIDCHAPRVTDVVLHSRLQRFARLRLFDFLR